MATTADRISIPRGLRDLRWSTWRGVLVRSVKGFMKDNCTDWAAALTYYGVLALFPALIVIVALVGLVSEGDKTVTTITDLAEDMGAGSVVANDSVVKIIEDVTSQDSASVLLSFGLIGALWSASGFIGAFTRASNAIYGVAEGRPIYKLRPLQLLVTATALVLLAMVAVILIVSGPVTDAIGEKLSLGDAPKTLWTILKWPVLVMAMLLLLALMFWIAPNV